VHYSNGLPLLWLGPSRSERARPISAIWPDAEPGEAFSPVGTGGLLAKSGRPLVGGGVAGEQAGRVVDRIRGRREGRSSLEDFSTAEGIGGRERTMASQSRGHRQGPSGWGGSTRRCNAWGGIETVRGGLEWAIRGGSAMVSTTVFRAAQEW
jgi:hypothetical protein